MAPPSTPEEVDIDGSHLRSVPAITIQRQAAVKLHGDFSPRWKILDCSSRLCGFTGPQAGTAGTSLIHSCTSELTRQGIWLTSVASMTSQERGGLAFGQPPCIAAGVGLYLNRPSAISGVESLRILETAASPFGSLSSTSKLSLPNLRA